MPADVIYGVDFRAKKRMTLEEMAKDITAQLSGLIGEEVACEMIPYNGAGIDGMDLGKEPA